MTIERIRALINDENYIPNEVEINSAIRFFMSDSEGDTAYIPDFFAFCFWLSKTKNSSIYDNLHLCNQKYIAGINPRPDLKRQHLPFLYLREIEYYEVVNSYSECIRCVNKIMDMEDVPDFCMAAALSQAIDIFMTCGLKSEAERYVEALRVFSNICDLPDRNLIVLDCNLMYAFASMGKRKEYDATRRNIAKYSVEKLGPDIVFLSKLFTLGSEAVIDRDGEPQQEYLDEFCKLMDEGDFSSGLTADYAEVIVPIIKWVKDRLPADLLVRYTLNIISCSDKFADKLDMYSVLIDYLKLDPREYAYIYDDYHATLKNFYYNVRDTHKHEVVGEMMSYAVEKQYRQRALTDELTGIGNRTAYESELESVKAEVLDGKLPSDLIVMAMDVNGLKGVNDNYGHQAGDDYIRGAADCLGKAVGNYGHIYRTGGDEFTAIIRAINFPIESVIEVLREALASWTDEYGNQLSMAVGYAVSTGKEEMALDQLLNIADVAMYKDKSLYYKQTGKDRRTR